MAEPLGYHVICRLEDDRVIAPTVPGRRVVSRAVVRVCRGQAVFAFGLPDTHLHFAHAGSRADGGRLVQRLGLALRRRLSLPVCFAPARHRTIESQRHLANVLDYILRQQLHHGLRNDPHHEGSSLPDLLGLRIMGAEVAACALQLLPRLRRSQLVALLGVQELAETNGPVELVLGATLSATALPDLMGRTPEVRAALRAATAILEPQVGLTKGSKVLDVSRERLSRLGASPPDPRLVRAIRLQLGLRQALAHRAGVAV